MDGFDHGADLFCGFLFDKGKQNVLNSKDERSFIDFVMKILNCTLTANG